MLLASDGITIGEKRTTVLQSKIGVNFFTVWITEALINNKRPETGMIKRCNA